MRLKKAFTMIELIFVIVVMGILAKFGVEFLAQAYNTFIFSKINNELQAKSNHAVEFIAKRLESRIPPSTIKRELTVAGFKGVTESVANPDDYNILEWIGYDIDGFRGKTEPFWSGIIDLNESVTTAAKLTSPKTDYVEIDKLVKSLSYSHSTINDVAIMFNAGDYNPNRFGWDTPALTNQNQSIHPVKSTANDELLPNVGDFSTQTIYNRYMLSWTAYALVHNPDGKNKLYLYYNFQPWQGEAYNTTGENIQKQLIMEDVSEFRIKPSVDGRLFSIKVCVKSNLTNEEHALCKEKTIF